MKVKEIDRTANIAWSPAAHHPVYLATGTAAQQLDATFSTSAAVEIYKLDLTEPGLEMQLAGSVPSDVRFHKLVWGPYGMGTADSASGMLVGGADKGAVYIWNPAKLINQEKALVHKLEKHTGAVAALDFNNFQNNLLATGASESEIYIWDLNSISNPMNPGAKSQPPDDVTCLAWNKQVQHILSSTYAGRCVVWDLRKNEPIIKVSDSMSRIKCKLVAWHPEVATQMCLTSEDDHSPVIQLWDLRFATSPLKTLENHQRGILSIAWCPQDPDLLLSCGKDNRILCWNPNSAAQTGEVVYELPTSNQWSFDVQWCPRNPAVISSCSFDGHISIYSLMGGSQVVQPSNKVADSFPADPFAQVQQQQKQAAQLAQPVLALSKPPKWLRRPIGASFGFGGKLVTFDSSKPAHPQQPVQRLVHISQVVTETDLVSRSAQLESALSSGQYVEFCNLKIANSKNTVEENMWNFLRVNFDKEPRARYLQLLGYDQTELSKKMSQSTGGEGEPLQSQAEDDLSQKLDELSTGSASSTTSEGTSAFDHIAETEQETVDMDAPLAIAVGEDTDGMVTQAILTANFEAAVEMCLHDDRMAEAIILAIAGGPELLARTQKKFFSKNRNSLTRLISGVVTRNFENLIRTCELQYWKEALAVALTYAKPDEFSGLCDILGSRLESEKNGELASNAMLCYICAGNVSRLVDCWEHFTTNNDSPAALQDLVEKVMVLQKSVELARGQAAQISEGMLATKLSQYAALLAAQGSLSTAINYLGNSQESNLAVLRHRLYLALGQTVPGMGVPAMPFPVVDVQPEGAKVQPAAQPAYTGSQNRQRTSSGFHQAEAGNFATTTTPTYYGGSQYGQTAYSQAQPTYTPSQPTSAAMGDTVAVSKGPLSHKYPTYPAATSAYGVYDQQYPPYSQAYGYSVATSQPATSLSPQDIYNPAAHQMTPGAPHSIPSSVPLVPAYQDVKPNKAWNDPPVIKDRVRKTSETSYEPPAPITQPIVGVPQPDQTPPGAPNYGSQQGQYYNPAQYQPQQQQQQAPPQPAPVKEVVPPKPKGPIPAEHLALQEVFDKLAKQCMASATNPQMKRKLEDVLRKLEALYDKLRENGLSTHVTQGLHYIIQCIQAYDYQSGLAYHAQMISQSNFSEISSFMPGIKVLIQVATQLNVYVQ